MHRSTTRNDKGLAGNEVCEALKLVVGAVGFELTTLCSQSTYIRIPANNPDH